jgi:hypothetical protein
MTIATRLKELPLSEAARIDQEISERVRRVSSGRTNASEIIDIVQLIRERADLMMPRIFTEGPASGSRGSNRENVSGVAAIGSASGA